ncbi:MAG: hypothetical protein ABIA75_07465 [Candidatus Neomarinimicrobiota bacterium]
MNAFGQKRSRINFPLLLIALFSVYWFGGCQAGSELLTNEIDKPPDLSALIREYKFCSGRGSLLYTGDSSNRLSFSFSCRSDTAYIQFSDLIGRRTLYLRIEQDSVAGWDMLNNRLYDAGIITGLFPAAKPITAHLLIGLLWGSAASDQNITIDTAAQISGSAPNIDFTYSQTDVGLAIEKAVFKTESGNQKIELKFSQRQWGNNNPAVIIKIPDSVPPAQINY